MGFHVDTSEIKKAIEHYQKLSQIAQEELDSAKKAMNDIVTSHSIYGEVGKAVANDVNNNQNTILVGLKDTYKLVMYDQLGAYSNFQEKTGESSDKAVLNEEVLNEVKQSLNTMKTSHNSHRNDTKTVYNDISDLISLSMPSNQFESACDSARKHINTIIEKVTNYDATIPESSAKNILNVLQQQIEAANSMKDLSYTDPQFMEFLAQDELANAIQEVDQQITKVEKDAKMKADKEKRKKEEDWAKHHPLQNMVKNVSDDIGDWWSGVVGGTKNLKAPKLVKEALLLCEGAIGKIGDFFSSAVIGVLDVIQVGFETLEVSVDYIRGVKPPQWKLDDLQGSWENIKGLYQLGITFIRASNAIVQPWKIYNQESRQAVSDVFNMVGGIVQGAWEDVKKNGSYALGGYIVDVASMFIGAGEIKGALNGAKLGKGASLLNKGNKVYSLKNFNKMSQTLKNAMRYGDDALKSFTSKLDKFPIPIMKEVVTPDGRIVRGFGKGQLGDKFDMSRFSLKKGTGSKKASGAYLNELSPKDINNMSLDELRNSIPKDWQIFENNGRVHIKDANGNFRVRIDPPDKNTKYEHMHIFDENKNPLDIQGNIVGKDSTDAHIPWTDK